MNVSCFYGTKHLSFLSRFMSVSTLRGEIMEVGFIFLVKPKTFLTNNGRWL